jgi:hypothetical protein
MPNMRQYYTKAQWFVLLNCILIATFYFTDNLHFTLEHMASAVIALALVNGATLISANRYKDWKEKKQ